MINNFHKIELDILQSFYNLRKKALKDPNNQDAIRHEWIKNNIQEKLILKTVSKPKFLKRLFYLVIDENFWLEEDRSKLELEEGDRHLHKFKWSDNYKEIIEHDQLLIGERIRDLIYLPTLNVYGLLLDQPAFALLYKN